MTGAVGVVAAVEQRRPQALLVAAVGDLADELVDQVAAVGEDQDAAGLGRLDEADRGDRLAGAGRVLEPEAAGGAGVLRCLLDHLLVLVGRRFLPVLGLLVGGELLVLLLQFLVLVQLVGARRRSSPSALGSGSLFELGLGLLRGGEVAVAALVVGDHLLLGHQLGQGPGERVDLVRVQFGAVAQLRRFVGEEALQPQQQREVAAPLDRGVLGAGVELAQRGVEGAAARRPRCQRLGPLAVEQEGLAGKLRRHARYRRLKELPLLRQRRWSWPSKASGFRPRRARDSRLEASEMRAAGSQVIPSPGDLSGSHTGEPNVRIVITERMTKRPTRRIGPRIAVPAGGARRSPVAAPPPTAATARTPTTSAPWPARRRRWRPCTSRPTSCCPGGTDGLREADRGAEGLPGRGQRLGLLVRALPLRVPGPAEALRPLRQAGRLPRRRLPGRRRRRRDLPRGGAGALPQLQRPRRGDRRLARRRRGLPDTAFYDRSGELVYLKQGPYAERLRTGSRRSPLRAARADNRTMEAFVVIALVGFALLLAELLLPTGGVLAACRRGRAGRRRRRRPRLRQRRRRHRRPGPDHARRSSPGSPSTSSPAK